MSLYDQKLVGDFLVWQIKEQPIVMVACHKDHRGCGCPQMGDGSTLEEATERAIANAKSFLRTLGVMREAGLNPQDISGAPL